MQTIISMIEKINSTVNGFVWGPVMLALILLTGAYFTIGTGFFQFRRFGRWFSDTLLAIFRDSSVHDGRGSDTISQFQALATSLASTIGTGNIIGVCTALVAGGPGAVFWMWLSAILGMMTKYAENVLGNLYRYKDQTGKWIGGPMIYIERGLHAKWLAVLFAVFCMVASFGIGNMTQANSLVSAVTFALNVSPYALGIVLTVIVGIVLLGGIKRIAMVTEKLVPIMALFYFVGGGVLLFLYRDRIPGAFQLIFSEAFSLEAAAGGVGGYVIARAMRFGIARGVFSNEAGLGSSVIINSSSSVKEPVRQGMWGICEVFLDTIVVCTITALVVLCSGSMSTGLDGSALAIASFSSGLGAFGQWFVTISICCFAFSTLLGWSYYGERAANYLFGPRSLLPFRICFVAAVFVGSIANLQLVWSISDTFNGLMALPNLIAILLLSPQVFRATRAHFKVPAGEL